MIKNKFLTKKTRNLLFLCLLFFNTPALAGEGVSIVCPCTFERVNDTKANISFSLSFRTFNSMYHDMSIVLVGRESQGSLYGSVLGEAPLNGLSYSNDNIPIDVKMSLDGISERNIFIDFLLKSSDGKTLDRVHMTELPINYDNDGYYDYDLLFSSLPRIFLASSIYQDLVRTSPPCHLLPY